MDSAAKPETILTVTVTPAVKRKQWKWRLSQLAKEEEDSLEGMQEEDSEEVACSAPGQPQEQEGEVTEIINKTETIQSLFLSEVWDMHKDYSCC